MGKVFKWLADQFVVQVMLNLLVYMLYWTIIGAALTPAILFIIWSWGRCFPAGNIALSHAFMFAVAIMTAYFIFTVCGIIVFGLFIRIFSLGFKEGRYDPVSWTMIRWLILSGINNFACDFILPSIAVSPLLNTFYLLVGCKVGKNVRINTPFLYDAYLLKLQDNVVVGGKATLTCHIFERGRLILKPIEIGQNCVIGANAYIHPGVVMEQNSAVGVYAMVPQNAKIRSNTVYGHLPAMPYRELARLTRFSKDEKRTRAMPTGERNKDGISE